MRIIWLFSTLFLLSFALSAHAQSDPVTAAKRASQMLENAANALEDAGRSSQRVAALTQTVRAYEEGLSALREGMRRVAIRERTITLAFEAKEGNLQQLLGVLQTIGRSPAPLLMMHPSGPVGTARSGMILSDVTPALAREAEILRAQLEELQVLRALQESAATQLETALIGIQTARTDLAKAVADRTDLPEKIATDTAQMTALLKGSDTLQAFADGFSQLGDGEITNPADFEASKGKLALPARATLLHGFNEADAAGIKRPGLLYATQAQTIVTTPWPATVRYAGPLLDYGAVVILEPGKGYLLVLGGLDQLFVEDGQILPQGEAIGLMGGNQPEADSFLNSTAEGGGGNRQESLYIELRQDNAPIDPTQWFSAEKG